MFRNHTNRFEPGDRWSPETFYPGKTASGDAFRRGKFDLRAFFSGRQRVSQWLKL